MEAALTGVGAPHHRGEWRRLKCGRLQGNRRD
jgi:hypothetical protein